jgi:hypothetical protein
LLLAAERVVPAALMGELVVVELVVIFLQALQ